MKKEYIKPELTFVDFAISDYVMADYNYSEGVGDGYEGDGE